MDGDEECWRQRYAVESWEEFRELIGKVLMDGLWGDPDAYWFRGQANSAAPLRSSFDRRMLGVDPRLPGDVHAEMVGEFRRRLSSSEDQDVLEARARIEHRAAAGNEPDHELAALIQHYGGPSRMLDWTESPYIAAFFALTDVFMLRGTPSDEPEADDCSVVALDTRADAWRPGADVDLVRTDRSTNARVRHQRGVFTYNRSPFSTLEEYCASFYRDRPESERPLVKIYLPQDAAPGALRDLDAMGITSESMFPGLPGLARYAFVRTMVRHFHPTGDPVPSDEPDQ